MATTKKSPQDRKAKVSANVTVQGVELSVSAETVRERLSDWDVAEMMSTIQDDESEPGEKLSASVKVLRFLLGDDYARVKAELRAAHDGKLTQEIVSGFMSDLFGEIAPNS